MKKINNKGAVPVGLIILLVVAALAVVAVFAFKGFGFGAETVTVKAPVLRITQTPYRSSRSLNISMLPCRATNTYTITKRLPLTSLSTA